MGIIAIVGLGNFACRCIDELAALDSVELFIADKNREIVERYKDKATHSAILDVVNFDLLKKVIPEDTTHAIVDMGHDNNEASILVTNYLHKLGIQNIFVKSQGDTNAEILKLVGATKVILPDLVAARQATQLVASTSVFDFLQVSSLFFMAEVGVKNEHVGKTLIETQIRKNFNLNVIAFRAEVGQEFDIVADGNLVLKEGMHLLVAGTEGDIKKYLGTNTLENAPVTKLNNFFKMIHHMKK